MIKFFQKLKAKKGFTLVELIVVIAIIGVLAAILIPTMLGYVTNSRVTSADSTAASLAKEIDSFLTDCDTNGYGMKKGTTYETGTIAISGGTWTVTLETANYNAADFNGASGVAWTATGAGSATDAKTSAGGNATKLMAIQLAGLFPDVQDGNVAFALSGGHCIACAFTSDTSAITVGNIFAITAPAGGAAAKLTNKVSTAWDGNTAGVTTTGVIIGTSPKLGLSLS